MTKKTTRTRAEAKRLMWEYYRDNKETLPKRISEFRGQILDQLTEGTHVKRVFEEVLRVEH